MTALKFDSIVNLVDEEGMVYGPHWKNQQYELWSLRVEGFPVDRQYARAMGRWAASAMPKFIMRFKKASGKWVFVGVRTEKHYTDICRKYNFSEIEK